MPLSNSWAKWKPSKPPDVVGVYELGKMTYGKIRVVYIGYGIISDRLKTHKRSNKYFDFYRCLRVCDRRRARQIEKREQKNYIDEKGELPTYNERIG